MPSYIKYKNKILDSRLRFHSKGLFCRSQNTAGPDRLKGEQPNNLVNPEVAEGYLWTVNFFDLWQTHVCSCKQISEFNKNQN